MREDVLTIAEVVEVVRRLDGRRGGDVSARQLRYWDTALAFGAGRATDGPNAARTYTRADVALVRLVRRLQRDEVRDRVIWALLLHLGGELRTALREGVSRVLHIAPNGRAELLTVAQAASRPARECYPLAAYVAGVADTVSALRAAAPAVWNGAKLVPVQELAAV